jgi:hypothetical protein
MPNVGFNMGRISKTIWVSRFSDQNVSKDKLHTLKMWESDGVTKHIHIFQSHLKQLLVASTIVLDVEVILVLMRSMPSSYKMFISSLRRQPKLTLLYLITNLIQE